MNQIAILLATFRRPQVAETIASLAAQDVPPGVSLRLIVADNDETESARHIVAGAACDLPFEWTYLHAPAQNISIARNACLDAAGGADWVAFIDDDEIAASDWLMRLCEYARQHELDGVFGHVLAVYPPDAPGWMRRLEPHSHRPPASPPPITGSSGNTLLRWRGTPWQNERFDLSRGRSGGEDTEFFMRLHRMGARYGVAPDAVLCEPVIPARLSLDWLRRRRFRMGQTHAVTATTHLGRARLLAGGAAKAGYCALCQQLARDEDKRHFWMLRGALHRGVVAGALGRRQAELYGGGE
ncbi:MAG: glycosyltransferase family 2 protein [Paracoccus sp. (in: a-proteobacteria)]|nr:glycosyltransferase family 2 protein [Paracoccus sp. (in: a-proteobacteria)]